MTLLAELRRRNVLRAAIAYVVTAWFIVESSSSLLDIFRAPDWAAQTMKNRNDRTSHQQSWTPAP